MPYRTTLIESPSKAALPSDLHKIIIQSCQNALQTQKRNIFTIALSGGSLPSFLSGLTDAFHTHNIDPHYDKWHVLLADERAVPLSHNDSNMKALQEKFLKETSIPPKQIYSIDETLLEDMNALASSYEEKAVQHTLSLSNNNKIDVAVLGFGPDGHTCSLFPSHDLLKEDAKLVTYLTDSPKPPPNRITLTFPVLNQRTSLVVFCGAGESKGPILKDTFETVVEQKDDGSAGGAVGRKVYDAFLVDPPPYPCGMVRPDVDESGSDSDRAGVVWIVDSDAVKGAGWSSSE